MSENRESTQNEFDALFLGLPQQRLTAGMAGRQAARLDPKTDKAAWNLRSVRKRFISDFRSRSLDIDSHFVDALTLFYEDEVAEEFFIALQGNSKVSDLDVEFVSCEKNGVVYERLGRTLGTMSKLSCLHFCFLDEDVNAACARAAFMLAHARQVKHVEWDFYSPVTPADDSTLDADTALSSLAEAFEGNHSIESTTLRLTASPRTDLTAGICQSMKGLLGLREITLIGSWQYPFFAEITGEDAITMSEVFQIKSLRRLVVFDGSFADVEASLTFSQAIARSALAELRIQFRKPDEGMAAWTANERREDRIPLDVARALTGSHLRRLELTNVTFLDYGLAMAFCRALAGSQIRSLELDGLEVHEDAITALGKSICRPCLEHLDVSNSVEPISGAIGASLNSAPNLQVLRIRTLITQNFSEISVVRVLGGCTHCPDLVDLRLDSIGSWNVVKDAAAAECIRHCGKLVKIDFGYEYRIRGNYCPAFLAACQAHRVVEKIIPHSRCLLLRAALDLVTAKNKDTRVHRIRFEKLAMDGLGRAAFSRVLARLNNKPHLIFLALTSNKPLFSLLLL